MRGSRVQFPPSAPHVTLMTEPPSKPRKPSRTKKKEDLWRAASLILVSMALIVTIAAVVFKFSKNALRGPDYEDSVSTQVPDDEPVALAEISELPESPNNNETATPKAVKVADKSDQQTDDALEAKRAPITAAVRAFFEADSVQARLPHVRDASRVQSLMNAYHEKRPVERFRLRNLGWLVPVDEPGHSLAFVQAMFEDATPSSLVVEETAEGQFLVDWECLVRYGELAWNDFLKLRPSKPTLMRLIASKPVSRPITGALAGREGEWLELRHPAEAGTILGHFDHTDPKFAALIEQLESGNWREVPLTLRVAFPSQSQSGDQVHIASVEGKGWLILKSNPQG